jgi:hypothetical protein
LIKVGGSMKKNNKVYILVSIILIYIMSSFSAVAAKPTITASLDISGYKLVVSGLFLNPNIVNGVKNNNVSITIFKPQKTEASNVLSETNILKFDIAVANTDGSFTYEYTIGNDVTSGYIEVLVGGFMAGDRKSLSQYYASELEAIELVNNFKNKNLDNVVLKTIFEDGIMILGKEIKGKYFATTNKDRFISILNKIIKNDSYICSSMIDVKTAVNEAFIVENLNIITTNDELISYLASNKDKIMIDLSNLLFSTMPEEAKTNTLNAVCSHDFLAIEDIKIFFNETMTIQVINSSDRSNILVNIIKYNNYIGVSQNYIDKYNNLSTKNKASVVVELDIDYLTISDIKDKFINIIDNVKQEETTVVSKGTGGGTTFKAPTTPIVITPPPIIPEVKNSFSDLDGCDWAVDSINYLADAGVLNGKAENIFAPSDNATKEEFVKIVVLAFKIDSKISDKLSFIDIKESDWFYPFVSTAVDKKIINGVSENKFGIGKFITREEVATICYRAIKDILKSNNTDKIMPIDFDNVSDFAKDAVLGLWNSEIIKGYEDKFNPKGLSTRAEIAVIVNNCLNNLLEVSK